MLLEREQLDEASSQFQQAADLEPGSPEPKLRLREVLLHQGRVEEAVAIWAKALDSEASSYSECDGYAELCLILGRQDEYHRACGKLLTRFGSTTDPRECEQMGRACSGSASRRALAARRCTHRSSVRRDKSTYPKWLYPYFLFAKALAEDRSGRYESAIAICEGEAADVLGPALNLLASCPAPARE